MLSSAPVTIADRIRSISLRPITEDDMIKQGVVEVNSFKQFMNGEPVANGTYSPEMGTIFEKYQCGTCGNGLTKCPGHPGYYSMNFPAQHMIFEKVIIKHLRLICVRCYRYIMDPTVPTYSKKLNSTDVVVILKYIADAKIPTSNRIFCDHCNNIRSQAESGIKKAKYEIEHVQPKYKKSPDDPINVGYQRLAKFKNGKYVLEDSQNHFANMIYNDEILALFEKLPDSELTKFGIPIGAHPRHLLTRYLYILPVNLRFINNDKNQSYNNHITSSYEKIFKDNEKIPAKPSKNDTTAFRTYITAVKSMISKYAETIKSSNDDNETIASLLAGGKSGVIRKDMLAKQCGHILRDVIVCNPSLPVDTIEIPMEQAMELFVKVHVTPFNINYLQKFVDNCDQYPGCNMIKCAATNSKRATKYLKNYRLQLGDIVFRHLIDGDLLPFHRHPTITPTCIMAVKLRINRDPNNKSIGLNDALCDLYNADFDGDMMNGYNIIGEKERIETSEIMQVKHAFPECRLGVGSNFNILGQIQDAVIAIGLMTMPDVKISQFDAIYLFSDIPILEDFTKPFYTGREIFSMVLPDINYRAKSPIAKNDLIVKYLGLTDDDINIVIENGQVKSGIICDSIIKNGYGSLYHSIFHRYGSEVAIKIVHKHQQLARRFLEIKSYTLGFKDILYGRKTEQLINLVQSKIMTRLRELDTMLMHGQITPPIGKSMKEHLLSEITKIHSASENAYLGAILHTVHPLKNNIFKSIIFGAKGKLNNLYAIMACVGLIKLDGKFIPQSLDMFRHSIFSKQCSSEPSTFGYVAESYKQGISHANMYNTSSAARQNIITKSMVTGEAGAEGRNAIKIAEPLYITNNHFTARNNGTNIIEFVVGDDGFEPALGMKNDYSVIQKSDDELRKMFAATEVDATEYIDQIIKDKHRYVQYAYNREKIGFIYKCDFILVTPIDYKTVIDYVIPKEKYKANKKELTSTLELVDDWIKNIHYIKYNPGLREQKREMLATLKTSFNSIRAATRVYLNPKFLESCKKSWIELLLKTFEVKILDCLYTPGKNIGTVIGQTLTAPFTQYLIDAHHHAATGGTSREALKYFKSIISLKKFEDIQQKRMYIYLKKQYEEDPKIVESLANYIISKPLSSFINKFYALVESYGQCVKFPQDKEFHTDIKGVQLYKLVFRYTLNAHLMKIKHVDIADVCIKIEKELGGQAVTAHSPKPVDGEYILCLYFTTDFMFNLPKKANLTNETEFWKAINDFRLNFNKTFITNAIPNITDAAVKSKPVLELKEDGTIAKRTIYFIQTNGIEMESILCINMVDKTRTRCSHIRKTYDIFGMFAAKEICISELEQTLATLNLAYNNFTFLANIIFELGTPENLGETGQKKREANDIFLRMATKNPIASLASGALDCTEININSPTANLMAGQIPLIGTNYNQIYYNVDFIAKSNKDEDLI